MELQRVCNGGILLKLDGTSLLLDGLCSQVGPYMGTPELIYQSLLADPPEMLCFTHRHPDHFSEPLAADFQKKTLRPICGPERLPFAENFGAKKVGNVQITPIKSRHLGKTEPDLTHVSFVIEGSQCLWFMGDAAPAQWRNRTDLPRPHVIVAPFAYAATESAWKLTSSLTDRVVLVHMPSPQQDPHGLWPMVQSVIKQYEHPQVWIPEIGQKIVL